MKKIVLVILGLAIAAALIVACGFSFTESQSVTIDASVDIVAPQVSSLPNWKHWYGERAGRLSLVRGGPVAVVVRDTGRSFEEAVVVVPEKDGRSTRVVWSRPMTVWQRITGPGFAEMLQHLASLKNYIEDPRNYYGFEMHIRIVTDTLFATRDARVAAVEVASKRPDLLRALRGYVEAHPEMHAGDSVITGHEALADGLVHLVVGVPVGHRGPESDSVRFLQLPRGGRLLSGVCGDSTQLGALKLAMDRYMADKRLQLVAIPFTEEGDRGYELNYPIW